MVLPPELYGVIIQNVDTTADLHRLLFVSRLVSYEAERILYHKIHIIRNHMVISMGLFFHLAHCQRVAHYVQELKLSPPIPTSGVLPDQYWHSISLALSALSHLRVLEVSTDLSVRAVRRGPILAFLPSSIFLNCSFKLEVLKLDNYVAEKVPTIDFTDLKELSLRYGDTLRQTLESRRDTFISLQILASSLYQFLELGTTNTCRVKALELLDTLGYNRLRAQDTFALITSLKLESNNHHRRMGVSVFPSLRYLCYHRDHISDFTIPHVIMADFLHTLTSLIHLEKFFLNTNPRLAVQYPPDLHTTLFTACSSLQELVLSCDGQNAQLWQRNSSELVHIPVASIMDEWKDPRWY